MDVYNNLNVFYGDIHTHCDISYGHGSLKEAFQNAREQLDFCSVTGHADWPDMAEPNPRIGHIIEILKTGCARLRERWADAKRLSEEINIEKEDKRS